MVLSSLVLASLDLAVNVGSVVAGGGERESLLNLSCNANFLKKSIVVLYIEKKSCFYGISPFGFGKVKQCLQEIL